jgi:hypothetical protein
MDSSAVVVILKALVLITDQTYNNHSKYLNRMRLSDASSSSDQYNTETIDERSTTWALVINKDMIIVTKFIY